MASFLGFLVLLACVCSGFGQDNDKQPSCTTVKTAYRLKRLAESDVPPAAVDGDDLRVCPKNNGKQCCNQRMEVRFGSLASDDFDKSASSKVGETRALFNDQAKTFDDYFRGLIKKSQQELHTMFEKIYGSHYVQNTKIFMDLFVDLTNYYNAATSSDITNIMNSFFTNLMRRMFEIMNGQYQFSDKYLDCVSRNMDKLTPFGDVPEKLTPQVRKVMIHARTFTKALHEGRDVIHMLENAISSKDCKNQLIKMKYCSWCKAMTSLKPCFKFCTDVHKDCLADVAKVDPQWQKYIAALNTILEKQAGPTNIQDVMTRLHLKISFAIMNFQTEKIEDVRKKVFQECGSPGQTKRSTDDFFLEGNNRQRRDDSALARTSHVNLDSLTTDYKAKMKAADNFWTLLPERMCDDIAAKDKNSDCWNGVGKGSYTSPDDGGNNVEDHPTPTVTRAIEKLKEIVEQLDAAINGNEINVIVTDDDDDDEEGSSGSGSGSGESGDGNEIPENTEKPFTSDNGIDNFEEDDNTLGGGVNEQPNAELKNSASRHVTRAWLLCSTLWVLSFALRA